MGTVTHVNLDGTKTLRDVTPQEWVGQAAIDADAARATDAALRQAARTRLASRKGAPSVTPQDRDDIMTLIGL